MDSETMTCCAACGKSSATKKCTACKSVRYCSVSCQRSHRNAHKVACKQKEAELKAARAAAAKKAEEELFAEPPQRDICPICVIRLPFPPNESTYHPCCGKMVCTGCDYKSSSVTYQTNMERRIANLSRETELPMLDKCCAFCRAPESYILESGTHEVISYRMRKRMEANDPEAYFNMAGRYHHGIDGHSLDHRKAFELMSRAAEIGLPMACYNLGCYYQNGTGVARDTAKAIHYFHLAAKKGNIAARYTLGFEEAKRGNDVLAMRHWLISAAAGDEESMKYIGGVFRRGCFSKELLSKEMYEKTLRAYQAAKNDVKSDARDEARSAWAGIDAAAGKKSR